MGNLANKIWAIGTTIGSLLIIGGLFTGEIYLMTKKAERNNAYIKTIKILDKNHDGKLSSD